MCCSLVLSRTVIVIEQVAESERNDGEKEGERNKDRKATKVPQLDSNRGRCGS